MLIRKSYKYRIYPTKEQASALAIQFGHNRFVYNRYLDLRKQFYFATGQTVSYTDCANDLVSLKTSEPFDWLKQADSQVLQQSLKDLDRAYQNFFRMCKEGTVPPSGKKPRTDGMPKGYPRFKSRHDEQSIRYPQRFKFTVTHTYLPKVGWVRTVFHRPLEGQVKNVTVSRTKTGKYFVSIQCEMEINVPTQKPGKGGVDLGLKDFVTLSDGRKVKPPTHLRKAERRLKIRQRRCFCQPENAADDPKKTRQRFET